MRLFSVTLRAYLRPERFLGLHPNPNRDRLHRRFDHCEPAVDNPIRVDLGLQGFCERLGDPLGVVFGPVDTTVDDPLQSPG